MKNIGILYSKSFKDFNIEEHFLTFSNLKFIYIYTDKMGDFISIYTNMMKISKNEINTDGTENDFIKSCCKVIDLSDIILVLCQKYETNTSLIKFILNYAQQKNTVAIVYKEKNEQLFIA